MVFFLSPELHQYQGVYEIIECRIHRMKSCYIIVSYICLLWSLYWRVVGDLCKGKFVYNNVVNP